MLRLAQKILWRLKMGKPPEMDGFFAAADDVRPAVTGRSADLVFGNQGPSVDKWIHYLPVYDRLFSPYVGKPVRFLEIGVYRGGSMKLWREFFGSSAIIYGVDVNPACAVFDGQHAQVRIGSQDDTGFLQRTVAEMGGLDLVLDDGSHIARHQRVSFEALFPLLEEGGLYLIEDTHTSYWPSQGGGLRRGGTAIEYMKDLIDKMHEHYYRAGRNTPDAIPPIEAIEFLDSMIAIRKRKQAPRARVVVPPLS